MKFNKLALLFIPLLLSSCSRQSNLVKIFISSFKDVDINALKAEFNSNIFSIEACYSEPNSFYYPFQYNTAREKDYDLFVLRDEEFLKARINEIFIEFNEKSLSYFHSDSYTFYEQNNVKYAIKLNDKNYKINRFITFEESHDYYIGIAKKSKNCGEFSIYSNVTSLLAFNFLDLLITTYE